MRTSSPGRTLTRSFRPTPIVALALGSALASVGCVDENFNRPELLKLPRVLAVQAEPPQPTFGTATTLRALVYEPPVNTDAVECSGSDAGPKYQWDWCPFPTSSGNGFECPAEAQQALQSLYAMLGLGDAPSLDLGAGETATFVNPFPAPLLYALCKGEIPMGAPTTVGSGIDAGAKSIFACRFAAGDDTQNDLAGSHPLGFPVTVRMLYTPSRCAPPQEKYGTPLTTVFTVYLPTDETVPLNQNPVVGDLYAYPALKGSDPIKRAAPGDQPDATSPEPADAGASDDGGAGSDGGGAAYDGGGAYDGGAEVEVGSPVQDFVTPPLGTAKLDPTWVFPRNKRVGLWLDLPLSSSEPLPRPSTRDVVVNDRNNMQIFHFEQLNLSWFTEAGDFGGEFGQGGRRTGYDPEVNQVERTATDEDNLEKYGRQNYIAFPLSEDYKPNQARFIVVVRDSRGGVTWTSAQVSIGGDKP